MIALILILNLGIGFFVLVKGLKYYSISFALCTFFPLAAIHLCNQYAFFKIFGFASVPEFFQMSSIIWGIIILLTSLAFIFSKIVTYVWLPLFIIFSLGRVMLLPFYPEGAPPAFGYICLILSAAFWMLLISSRKLRTYARTPMTGILAGTAIYTSAIFLPALFPQIMPTFSFFPLIASILFIICIGGALLLEITLFAPKLNKKI